MSIDELRLTIYECYDSGDITYGEKEYLLEQVKNNNGFNKIKNNLNTQKEIIKHKAKIKILDDYISDQEKIGGFKAGAKKGIATVAKHSEEKKLNKLNKR